MKHCPKCNQEHSKPGTYCSRSCANIRVWSEETNRKRRSALKGKRSLWIKRNPEALQIAVEKANKTKREKYLAMPFEQLGSENKRKRVFEEQDYTCNRCKLKEWQDQPITLELDHKDGNNKNNSRENLEALCPNCHALTPTWRGRNR